MPCHHHATSGGFSSILRYHICVGGVCIPLAGLIPFLIALLHAAGYLQRLRAEWFTLDYWKYKFGFSSHENAPEGFVCEGGVCRPVAPAADKAEGETGAKAASEAVEEEKKDQ